MKRNNRMYGTRLIYVSALLIILMVADGACSNAQTTPEVEISLAPIHEANITMLMSNPPQVEVYIKGGLADGCTTFNDIEITQEGDEIDIKVTVQHPKGVDCPAVYTYFEEYVNLGSDFTAGTTYTVNVNDYSTTFEYY